MGKGDLKKKRKEKIQINTVIQLRHRCLIPSANLSTHIVFKI